LQPNTIEKQFICGNRNRGPVDSSRARYSNQLIFLVSGSVNSYSSSYCALAINWYAAEIAGESAPIQLNIAARQ
jgi:hypothetical protein